MPYRILAFPRKNASLTTEQFRDYCETKHIALIIRVSGDLLPSLYKGRYMHLDKDASARSQPGVLLRLGEGGDGMQFDCVTELVFQDEETSVSWMGLMSATEEVKKDEEVFSDRGKMFVVAVEECETLRQGK